MDFHLKKSAAEKILIAAHRGSFGGNIPCNTIASYEIALKQGADIIEVDVEMGGDGKLHLPSHYGASSSVRPGAHPGNDGGGNCRTSVCEL